MFGGMKKKMFKRALSFVMAFSMVASLLDASTMTALAAEVSDDAQAVEQTEGTDVEVVEAQVPVDETVDVPAENDEVIEGDAGENLEVPADAIDDEEEKAEDESLLSLLSDAIEEVFSSENAYEKFKEDEVVANLSFGNDVTAGTVYDVKTGFGFDKVEFPEAAKGWSGNVYYPRVETITESDASYVSTADGALAIASKVWTETESTGYGVYTYENTDVFDYDLENADYKVEVTFKNPTADEYNAYVEAEDITKASGIAVPAGQTKTVEFVSCLVDGKLSLKFLGTSAATTEAAAATQTVYVSNVKITRLATNEAREDGKTTVFIASDSTVQSYDSYYYPQTGWGQTLANFFGDGQFAEVTSATAGYSQSKTYETSNAVVENRAIGGRSSSSFVTEGKLDDLLEDVRPGDYLLVQWGHNDSTYSRPNRYVAASDFEKWMQYYVDGAIQRGATPVLVTPVARYSYTTDSDGNLISYASNFEAYRQVMIKMSKEQGIALIDLTQRSIDIANDFGIDGGKSLWLHVNAGDYTGAYAGGATDSTHLQWYGAYKFAQAVAKGIIEAGDSAVYTNENNASSDNKASLSKLAELIDLRAAANVPGAVTDIKVGTVGASSASMSWTGNSDSELYYIYRAQVDSAEQAAEYKFADDAKKYSVSRGTKFTDATCKSGVTYVYAVRGFNSLGLGTISENIIITTKSAGQKFDFNYNNSTTQSGWIGINQNQMYDSEVGYGWISAPNNGRSRGNNGTVSEDLADMAGDFNLGAGVFAVDVPNGDYEVTIYAADLLAGTSTIKTAYNAEGVAFGGVSCRQSLGSVSGQVRVVDGQLNIEVGGTNAYINGLTITEILKAPTSLTETEASVTNGKYTALLSFVGVDGAAGYNYYIKGNTDSAFKLERTFDAEKYTLGVTEYGAISVNLGEDYEYYVTCYTADGTESAPSNTVTVKALLSNVEKPAAPENVKCVDPTSDTEGVQNTITISWDESKVADSTYPVIKYIVYRSDCAEGSKSFTGFEKVGETTERSFTDKSEDLSTNIHYYYKVCGSNAGGAGELSEACETPVTGKLAAANMETLTDRAVYAIRLSDKVKAYDAEGNDITEGVYVSWRAFEEEFSGTELTSSYTVKVNGEAVKGAIGLKSTNVVLTGVPNNATITVEGASDGIINGGLKVIPTKIADQQYVEMQLNKPADETMPDGTTTSFTANDMSVGDVDGDGVLDLIVKWYPGNARDNSGSGYTGKTFIDAYKVDWVSGEVSQYSRVDLGVNIRSGAHYTQFQVWDFDGDGKAEVAVKTADGSTSYKYEAGNALEVDHVGECNTDALPTDVISPKYDYRNSGGYILSGKEYFTMFNLEDGTILDTVDYLPDRGTVSKWGDGYGNRVDRFLSATAYLDGVHPFAVMCRGYYTRTALTAYGTKDTDNDGIGDKIFTYWTYDTDNGDGPEGQGNHNLSVADVDNDGKDEIIYGASCYDHNGKLKYSTGMGHGDALHVSDWISSNDGLEVMEVHEEWNQKYQVEIHDAETGEVITGYPVENSDVGRGVAADIDPREEGAEYWASNGPSGEGTGEWDSTDASVVATSGSNTEKWNILSYGASPSVNATLYWDGDLLAEIQDHVFNNKNGNYYPVSTFIAKWDYEKNVQNKLLDTEEVLTSNGTKGNLGLIVDITGDWRDEFIARCSADDSKVRLYQTTYVTNYVVPCSLDDLVYREGVAWENVAYNQPAHTSYLISKGLVTAKLSQGDVTTNSATINFTPANDGAYGHDITAYEIYRDGELIDTVKVSELNGTVAKTEEEEEVPEEPVAPVKVEYSFDFGAGDVAEGYTQVLATNEYSKDAGFGFTDLTAAGNGTAGITVDDESLLADNVTFYDKTTDHKEFVVDLPNGTYDVTYSAAGKNYYNAITAEGNSIEANKFRFGSGGGTSTVEATVEVTDGQLNLVATLSKNGYFNIIFTAITVKEADDNFAARKAAYDTAKAKYDEYLAKQEASENTEAEDEVKVDRISKSFDFGAGDVAEGYTQVKADAEYSDELGYGFTSLTGLANKAYKNWSDDENAALYNDSVLGWIANGSAEFKVAVPDGKYDVTFTIANGSGAVYDAVTAEGVAFTDVRRGNSDIRATSETVTVEVADGELNIVNTVSKNGYAALYFTALTIEETEENYQARVEAAKKAAEAAKAPAEGTVYSYTDKNLASNKEYTYQIAAVVDGLSSFKSKEFKVKTLIQIKEVKAFELDAVVEGTKVVTDASELLPASVTVVDEDGKEQQADITWDVSKVDLNTVADYEVIGTVAGYEDTITKTLKVVANAVKGIEAIPAVNVIAGGELSLPAKVKVEYTNGSSEEVAVAWDTTGVDTATIGEYTATGTVVGFDNKVEVKVNVVADYPVSVDATSIEVAVGDTIVKNLPKTVAAKMASGNTSAVEVTWKTTGVDDIDTSKPSDQIIHGTVEGIDADVLCNVSVAYKALYKFDLGIDSKVNAEGWTTVTVNGKGGKKTASDLGVNYTQEKGYGFADADAVIEGRTESVAGLGVYPTNVVTDFALMTGQTFVVDVPNGQYLVQVMTNCGIGSTSATVDVEGTQQSFSANKNFTVKDYTVEVTDGQLTVTDKSSLARIGAIIVRCISVAEPACEHKNCTTDITTVDATCTEAGSKVTVVTCDDCGEEISRTEEVIQAAGHKEVTSVDEKLPTCTEDGYKTTTVTCETCKEVISENTEKLPAKGHSLKTYTTKATKSKDGSIVVKCTVCGHVESETVIAKIASVELSQNVCAYTGKANQPAVIAKDSTGKTLVAGTDYTVKYSGDGVKAGTYKATITFKGNYSGTTEISYVVTNPTVAKVVTTVEKALNKVSSILNKIIFRK